MHKKSSGFKTIHPLEGIKPVEQNREISIDTGHQIPGEGTWAYVFDKNTTLKEFETEYGHKYAITRNKNGQLELTEIYKEKDKNEKGEENEK